MAVSGANARSRSDLLTFGRDGSGAFYRDARAAVRSFLATSGRGRHGGWRLMLKGAGLAGLAAGFYAAALSDAVSTAVTLGCAVLFGLCALLFAISIGHEAAHETALRSRRANRILQFLAFAPLGADATLWRLRHTRSHHVSPNVSGYDVDVGENGVVRLSPDQKRHWYNRYQHIYAPFIFWLVDLHSVFFQDAVYVLKGRMANVAFDNRDPRLLASFALQKLAFVMLLFGLPWLVMDRPFWHIMLGALIVTFVNSTVFVFMLVGTHHCEEADYPEARENRLTHGWARHQLATSMDWSPLSPLANFIAGGANAHAAHHLFPNVSHVHYIPITRIIQREAARHGMPYRQSSLPRMIVSHLRHLKRLGRPDREEHLASCPDTDPGPRRIG